ncbi:MAG: carboxypeptidase-like regulatory domain-containing protein, partial [Candidatus Cloacimonetes bacterium]|nr:carboxypeptidase-like regulatory domain-containing protein [Candidatus Cloacimonadota bacterium]
IYDTDGVTELEYNDDTGGLQSYVSHTMDEDGTYYFRVGSFSTGTGAYGVELSGANLPVHFDNDLQARWVTGNAIPTEEIESIYEVMIRNPGNLAQLGTDYTVSLFLEGDIEIGTAPGEDIDPGEQIGFEIPWTPESSGVTYIYGVVNFAADEYLDNNVTDNFDVNVQSAGTIVIPVGDGTSTSYQIPANFFYQSSLSECWYYPEEIDFGGLITQIGYHTNWVTDLQDKPIRIWMGETTQPQALIGWIPAGDLTLVFDGTIDLPPGENDILIPLDTFFGYSGANNLVVMVQRPMDTQYYPSSNTWYITNDVFHPARTVHYYSDWDEMDPYNPSGGYVLNDLPNIGFYFDSTPTGSLEGHVYEDTQAGRDIIEGALVVIEGTTFSTYTDATGFFYFPYVFVDNYDVTVSAFGYYDETINVTITEDETTLQDFYLEQLPNVEVSGHVITSDTGADVVGAIVTLEGYDNYGTTTGDDGLFTLPGVYSGHTYTLTVSGYEGYETYIDETVVVSEVDLDLGDIIINELANSPFGVYVEEDH